LQNLLIVSGAALSSGTNSVPALLAVIVLIVIGKFLVLLDVLVVIWVRIVFRRLRSGGVLLALNVKGVVDAKTFMKHRAVIGQGMVY
jgi:hypothetical protein